MLNGILNELLINRSQHTTTLYSENFQFNINGAYQYHFWQHIFRFISQVPLASAAKETR